MGVDSGLGGLDVGIVDDGRDDVEDHEDDSGRKAGLQQGNDGCDDEEDVKAKQLRALQRFFFRGERSGGVDDLGHVAAAFRQDAGLFSLAHECGKEQNADDACDNGGQVGHEEGNGAGFTQRGGRTDGRAAPGQNVHDACGQGNEGRQGGALHTDGVVQGYEGRYADQEGDRARAVQVHDGSQDGGADADLNGVGAYGLDDLGDDGAEGACVGEDTEEQDGEDEHDAGSGYGADTLGAGDHAAQGLEVCHEIDDAGSVLGVSDKESAGDDAGDDGDRDEGDQRGRLLGHDQHQHEDDGDET